MFRLRTLGGAALERDGVILDTVGAQRKSLALLALLAASRNHGVSRERVAAYLWPESDTERARGALKQALHVIRRQVGSPEAIQGTVELRLNPSYIDSDVDAFLGAIEAGELDLATGLYGGPFLDGFHLPGAPEFEQWISAQRDEYARRYTSALERLASAAEARDDWDAAIEWLRRLQATDPLSARTTLRLMRAFEASGGRAAALRCAQVHEALLREELESPPDPEVAALAARLREEPVRPATPREAASPPAPVAASPRDATPVASPSAAAPGQVRPEVDLRTTRRRRPALPLAAVVLAVVVFVAVGRDETPSDAAGLPADRSLAVLPFANAGGDSAVNHLSEGLTEELSSALDRVEGLRVAPRTVALALKRRGLDVRAIADSLSVATVLEGTVQRDGDRLKVDARLLSARDRAILWSGSYDRRAHELLAVQEEIVRAIVRAWYPRQTGNAGAARVGRQTNDAEAYDLYLRGRHSWRQRTREALLQALVFYDGAIERDPGYVMAYVGLADAYVNLSNFGYRPVGEALARAEIAADRAVSLAPHLGETHASKGFVLASTQDFRASEAAFQRAIELNPSYAWAHHYYTLLLLSLGRTDEASEHNRHALGADPLSLPANATRGIILLQRGDYAGADRELERALTLSPDFQLTRYYLAVLRAAQGAHTEAERLLEPAALQTPKFTGMPGARALVLQRTGRLQAADSLLAELDAQARAGDERSRVNLAFAHAALGRLDAAFDLFYQVRWDVPSLVELRADPLLAPLRHDSRYPALLRKIGVSPWPERRGRPAG